MKCLLYIFILCAVHQFVHGVGIMEDQDDRLESADIININDGIKMNIARHLEENDDMSQGDADGDSDDADSQLHGHSDITSETDEEPHRDLSIWSIKSKGMDEKSKKVFQETLKRFVSEMAAGHASDLVGQNQHINPDREYKDLGRRFVPQYKYTEATGNVDKTEHNDDPVPEKAPPELVLLVAKESALMGPDKTTDFEVDQKKVLRSGDYWNGVWKEEVDVKKMLRSSPQNEVLGSVKAKIKPGTEFYKVVSRMKKMSPRLLYIINKKSE